MSPPLQLSQHSRGRGRKSQCKLASQAGSVPDPTITYMVERVMEGDILLSDLNRYTHMHTCVFLHQISIHTHMRIQESYISCQCCLNILFINEIKDLNIHPIKGHDKHKKKYSGFYTIMRHFFMPIRMTKIQILTAKIVQEY